MRERKDVYSNTGKSRILRKRRLRRRQIKALFYVMAVAILVLLIYLLFSICSLIGHVQFGNYENIVLQKAEVEQNSSETKVERSEETKRTEDVLASRETKVREQIRSFAKRNHLSMEDYPEELIESLVANAEKEEFVLNYPLKKGTYTKQNLKECIGQADMPFLLQWDDRWGYYKYGDGIIGVKGCGPTSLSMVALHLLQNEKYTPIYMAEYAMQNEYYAEGIGTTWDFMTDGARKLGLQVQEVTLNENIVLRHLKQGRPIICAMGPGDFTTTGHFIVLVGVENEKIRVYDCNSRIRSEKLWEFDSFKYQIKNMWAYSVE